MTPSEKTLGIPEYAAILLVSGIVLLMVMSIFFKQ